MGWGLNMKFILYKTVFVPKQYLKIQNNENQLTFKGFKGTN
jgi:hypothetical protein